MVGQRSVAFLTTVMFLLQSWANNVATSDTQVAFTTKQNVCKVIQQVHKSRIVEYVVTVPKSYFKTCGSFYGYWFRCRGYRQVKVIKTRIEYFIDEEILEHCCDGYKEVSGTCLSTVAVLHTTQDASTVTLVQHTTQDVESSITSIGISSTYSISSSDSIIIGPTTNAKTQNILTPTSTLRLEHSFQAALPSVKYQTTVPKEYTSKTSFTQSLLYPTPSTYSSVAFSTNTFSPVPTPSITSAASDNSLTPVTTSVSPASSYYVIENTEPGSTVPSSFPAKYPWSTFTQPQEDSGSYSSSLRSSASYNNPSLLLTTTPIQPTSTYKSAIVSSTAYYNVSEPLQHQGFAYAQELRGKNVTCLHPEKFAVDGQLMVFECLSIKVNGLRFANGMTCKTTWVPAMPDRKASFYELRTDFLHLCNSMFVDQLLSEELSFEYALAEYACKWPKIERVQWFDGWKVGLRDAGYVENLQCVILIENLK